jgi:hypothetical protein
VVVVTHGQKNETIFRIRDCWNNSGRGYIFCTESPIATVSPNPSDKSTLNVYTVNGTYTSTADNPSNGFTLSTVLPVINGVR